MFGFNTPNLATLASPYYGTINDVINGGYDFKNQFRNDYLADLQVAPRALRSQRTGLDEVFGIEDRLNTFDNDLTTSSNQSFLDAANSEADVAIFPQVRDLQDTRNVTGLANDVFGIQEEGSLRQNRVLEKAAQTEYNNVYQTTFGDSFTRAQEAYTNLANGGTNPRVQQIAQVNLMNQARRVLNQAAAGLPLSPDQINAARNVLISAGNFGVQGPTSDLTPAAAPRRLSLS